MDRLIDFKLGMASKLKQKSGGVASGGLKLQCIRNCHVVYWVGLGPNFSI